MQSLTILRIWLKNCAHNNGLTSQVLLFFTLSLTAATLALGSEQTLLMQAMPAFLWLILLLSSLLGLPYIFAPDTQNGTLDAMLLSAHSLPKLMALKWLAHFLATGLPLCIASPLILWGIDQHQTYPPFIVGLSLTLGALYFSSLGLLAAALALNANKSSALYATIVLPLSLPGLIFGAGALTAIPLGLNYHAPLFLLSSLTLAFITLSPFASALIIRMKVTS